MAVQDLFEGIPDRPAGVLRRELEQNPLMDGNVLVPLLSQKLFMTEDPASLACFEDTDGDLARRMIKERGRLRDWSEFADILSSKSLTASHARRAMLHTALGIRRRECA